MNKKRFNVDDFTFTGATLNPENRAFRQRVKTFEKDLKSLKDDNLDFAAKEEIKARIKIQFEVLKIMIAKTVMETELPLNAA